MSSTMSPSLEQALTDGASPTVVLDLVDEAIEQAAAAGDAKRLRRLSRRLEAVATERGGEWEALAIAGTRAGALAERIAPARPVSAQPPSIAPTPTAPVTVSPPPAAPSATLHDAVGAATAPAYAGWWIRAFAYLIDLFLLGAAFLTIPNLIPGGYSTLAGFVYILSPLAYFAGMHAYANGATVGKRVTGIRVETVGGEPVGLARAVGRALTTTGLWIVSIGGLVDLIVLAVDARKQSVHDKAAGTVVRHAPHRSRTAV